MNLPFFEEDRAIRVGWYVDWWAQMRNMWRCCPLHICGMAIVISTLASVPPGAAALESLCATNKPASGDAGNQLRLSGRQRRDASRHDWDATNEFGLFPARSQATPEDRQTVLAPATGQDQVPSPPVALRLGSEPTNADSEELASAKDALAILIRFPEKIAKIRLVASQFVLGDVGYHVSCSYCSRRFLGICTEKTSITDSRLASGGLGPEVQRVLQGAEQDGKQFSGDFNDRLRQWLKVTVPMIGSEIESSAEEIRQIPAQARAGAISTVEELDFDGQLRTVFVGVRVEECLSPANTHLSEGARQLKAMMGELASYLQRQNAYQQDLIRAKERLEGFARSVLKDTVKPLPCGQQDATNQLNQSKQHAEESLKILNGNFDEFKKSATEADEAGSKLLGTMMNFVNQFQFISEQLKTARDAQSLNRQIQSLHLNIAVQAWKDFSEYAAQQLQ